MLEFFFIVGFFFFFFAYKCQFSYSLKIIICPLNESAILSEPVANAKEKQYEKDKLTLMTSYCINASNSMNHPVGRLR